MRLLQNIKNNLRYNKVMRECGCVIKCRICLDIQNDAAECRKIDEHRYEYTCGKCGNVAIALYGIAPLPLWELSLQPRDNQP